MFVISHGEACDRDRNQITEHREGLSTVAAERVKKKVGGGAIDSTLIADSRPMSSFTGHRLALSLSLYLSLAQLKSQRQWISRACLFFSVPLKHPLWFWRRIDGRYESESAPCARGARSPILHASCRGPAERVWLCGHGNGISSRVVFNHKPTNEIGWVGVSPAINTSSHSFAASFNLSSSSWMDALSCRFPKSAQNVFVFFVLFSNVNWIA